jgi:hypothetical protein
MSFAGRQKHTKTLLADYNKQMWGVDDGGNKEEVIKSSEGI